MPAELLHGDPIATEIKTEVEHRVSELKSGGVTPALGTVLASDAPADHRFMDLKHEACAAVGIETRDHRFDADASERRILDAVETLGADEDTHAIFVQAPLPELVSEMSVRRRVTPTKDVDCFHPINLGLLFAGHARFVPATPAAVRTLLDAYNIKVAGRNVVIVGRSNIIGKPLVNMFLETGPGGNATVTVCHSRTPNLGEHTRQADILVTACGVPELVDGDMLSPGVVVVDVSANRTASGQTVGDVAFESARREASAITPVPGGVGPITIAALLENVVLAAEQQAE